MEGAMQYRGIEGAEFSVENRSITGYGIVFNSDSHPMLIWDERHGVVEVVEQISPDSLRDADMRDVISAYNHQFEKVLGRTSSGTMKITTDARGVRYRVDAPNTSYANDVLELLQRGDLRGSSFVFMMDFKEGYEIQEREDGKLLAIPKKIKRVYEMGPVINPAYPETTAENRSMGLKEAVTRFLQEKETVQVRKEEVEEKVEAVEQQENPVEAEEVQERQIVYPFPKGYYKVKAKTIKRV